MEFNSAGFVYECIPTVLGIRAKYEANRAAIAKAKAEGAEPPEAIEPVVIGLKVLTVPDLDQHKQGLQSIFSDHTPDKAGALAHDKQLKLIASKVVFIKGLVVDGREIKDFDDLYQNGPPELVTWINSAVYSTEELTEAQRKN